MGGSKDGWLVSCMADDGDYKLCKGWNGCMQFRC